MTALVLTIGLLLGQFAPQHNELPLDPERETRVQKLGKQIRCAVCQGLSISDSPASMARAQLSKVRELVVAGKSDQEIRDYFVARYGEWALLEPTANGANIVVWLGPLVLLVFGGLIILSQVKGRIEPGPGAAAAPANTDEDEYLKRVRSELEQ